jgi:YARHG domain
MEIDVVPVEPMLSATRQNEQRGPETKGTIMRLFAVPIAAALLALPLAAAPAQANSCYEIIGCMSTQHFPKKPLFEFSCQLLWEVRNGPYAEHGYCFKTKTGIEEMGNAGCTIHDQNAVPLNTYERANIATIRSVEKAKGCHYGG